MTTQINLSTLPNNIPSLFIPRVFPNIDEKRIRRIFQELNLGDIGRIDFVGQTSSTGEKFNRVFVHFQRWNAGKEANATRERVMNGNEIKIIYDDPWFWKVSAYRNPSATSTSAPKRHQHQDRKPAPRIQYDDNEPHKAVQMRLPIAPALPAPAPVASASASASASAPAFIPRQVAKKSTRLPVGKRIIIKKNKKILDIEEGEISD